MSGIEGLAQEVEAVGGSFQSMLTAPAAAGIPRDIRRARTYADNYAKRWLKKAEGDTTAKAVRLANAETAGSLERIAVTESSEALNNGRDRAAEEIRQHTSLLKVWDAQLDKLTCPICSAADGMIVGIREPFPLGVPGAVHPWCRCTWQVLTFNEHGTDGLIEPKEPAKVISLPSGAKAATSSAKTAKGELLGKATPEAQAAMSRKVSRLADALESGTPADQRAALRGIVKEALPNATSKDVTLKGKLRANAHALKTNNYLISATDSEGLHGWDGTITVDSSVFNRAKASMRKLGLAKPGDVIPMHETDSLRVLVHEELHGHSRATLASYKGAGMVLEEVGTELHARAAVTKLFAEAEFSGAYQDWIDSVVSIVQGAADDAEREVSVARVMKAHSKVTSAGAKFTSEHEAIDTFVSGLDLTPQAQQFAKDSISSTFKHLK